MKKTICIFALAALFCLPGQGRAANFYWGLGLLGSALETGGLELDMKNAAGYPPQRLSLGGEKNHYAAGLSLFYGLDFAWAGNIPVRLELESALYSGGSVKKYARPLTSSGAVQAVNVQAELDLRLNFRQNFNLWLDVPVGDFPLKPYLGGGLGLSFIACEADVHLNPGQAAIESEDSKTRYDYALGYQLGGGARIQVARRAFLDLRLEYLQKRDWDIKMSPVDLEFSTRSINFSIAFNYYF